MKKKPPPEEPAEPTPRWPSVWIALAFLVVSIGVYLGIDWWYGVPADVQATYVGRQSCVQCHQRQAERYTGSYHDKAMDLATEQTVLGNFNDATLDHHGITSRMFRRDGKFWINTEGPDGQLADFEIKWVFGVAPLQQYMVEFDRAKNAEPDEIGRVQVLRVSWDTEKKQWFHLDPPDVKEKLAPHDDLHWTGIGQRWNTMCADCHSTNLKRNFDPATAKYRTTFSEIDVSCETCHGPGSVHVELASAKSLFWDRERGYGLARLKGDKNVAEVEACAQCHSRRRILHADYQPGEPFDNCFAVEPLDRLAYYADGSNRDEVYEYGSFTQSKMFHKNIRCSDCHDPHSTQLKFSGNKVCTSCHQHPASKYDTPQHHHHKDESTGSSCVECHMPSTTYMAVDPRRDHGFRVPRPDLSVEYKTPNACTQCHLADAKEIAGGKREGLKQYGDWLASKDDEVKGAIQRIDQWCADATARWYKPKPRKEDKIVPAFTAARTGHPSSQQALVGVALDESMPAIVRSTAITELGRFARPDSPARKASVAALTDTSPLVRAAAISNLEGLDRHEFLQHGLRLLHDPSRLVRIEAGRVTAPLKSEINWYLRNELPRSERSSFNIPVINRLFDGAIAEYLASLNELNDRPGSFLAAGATYQNLGRQEEAEAAFRLAMRLDPNTVGPRFNLALLLARRAAEMRVQMHQAAQQKDRQRVIALSEQLTADDVMVGHLLTEEVERLKRDVALAPEIGALQFRLGTTLSLVERADEAIPALTKAVELEPNDANFHWTLAQELRRVDRRPEALIHAKRALDLWPEEKAYQDGVKELQRAGPD